MGSPITPSPRKPSCAIEVMILSMKPQILVTKRVYPEAIEYLKQHAEVDYEGTDDGLAAAGLLARARGKQAIASEPADEFTPDGLARLAGSVRGISNVAVGFH